jgi:GDP-L-fucose synthase
MPTNLYGENDNFDLEKSHVLPALIRKIHLGKALEENNWEEIKKDLNSNPIEGVNSNSSQEEILKILEKYGIKQFKIQNSKFKINIEVWGSGKPMREFLYSEDMADACVYLMEKVDFKDIVSQNNSTFNIQHSTFSNEVRNTHLNIGTGVDISIKELALTIKKIVGYEGELYFNATKPDGTMVKLTNPSKLHALGWKHTVELEEGIRRVYEWYLINKND